MDELSLLPDSQLEENENTNSNTDVVDRAGDVDEMIALLLISKKGKETSGAKISGTYKSYIHKQFQKHKRYGRSVDDG